MAWELRGKKEYFYRKIRIDGKVKSQYFGIGEAANLIDRLIESRRKSREIETEVRKNNRVRYEQIDDQIDAFSDVNQTLVDALFLINGFHQHKRQWRKFRK